MHFHEVFLGNQHEIWSKQHNGKVRQLILHLMRKYRITYKPEIREIEADSEDRAIELFGQEEAERWDWPYDIEDLGEVTE